MNWEKLLKKEYYIIDCQDFIYFARVVHVVGVGDTCVDSEPIYILDIKDFMGKNREIYMSELERFKTFEEAKEEAKRMNNIPENKKRANEWNVKDKFLINQVGNNL